MKKLFIFVISLLTFTCIAKSKPSVKKANRYFEKLDYQNAKKEYNRLLRGKRTPTEIYLKLAICYDKLNESVQATKFYAQSLEKEPLLAAEINYRLAYNMQKNGRYEAAKAEMKKFTSKNSEDLKSIYFNDHIESNPLQLPNSEFYIEESGLNHSIYSSSNISLTNTDTILFVSNRTKYGNSFFRKLFEVKDKTTKQSNTDIYEAVVVKKNDPTYENVRLRGTINKRFNDGQATMHPSNKMIYFSSESFRNRNFRKHPLVRKREGNESLFLAVRKGKKWKKIKVLPFIEADFSYVDPFVSSDGKYLYYASNQGLEEEDLDLWRVEILKNGVDFGVPENLGSKINTGFVERAPFISDDQVLYFTSDRWGGFGGLDIYKMDLKDNNAKPVNMGKGINTAKNESNFIYNTKLNFGFLSTDRVGRKDIYKVKPTCLISFVINVLDEETKAKLTEVVIELTDINKQVLSELESTSEGSLNLGIPCKKRIKASFKKQGYYYKEIDNLLNKIIDNSLEVYLKPIPKPSIIIEENEIVLKDIAFDFDDASITEPSREELNKLVQWMQENPTIKIKIIAHTDNVGNHEYNLLLSEKRAKSTLAYLENNGIDKGRVEAIGVGNTRPKVSCKDCTEEDNKENRRSEFILVFD